MNTNQESIRRAAGRALGGAVRRATTVVAVLLLCCTLVACANVRRPVPPALDWEIEHDLRHDLRWNPLLDAEAIDVDVEEGVVTLRGLVQNLRGYVEALQAAYDAGAKRVRSDALHVETGPAELAASADAVGG